MILQFCYGSYEFHLIVTEYEDISRYMQRVNTIR